MIAMENKGHRVSKYDEDLLVLNNQVIELLTRTRDALRASLDALNEKNPEKARWVVAGDAAIDRLEMEVDHIVFDLIMRYQPVSIDLRNILASMRISSDLERIGDNAKGIARRVLALGQVPMLATRRLAGLGSAVLNRFDGLIEAYERRNPIGAGRIWERDCDIDEVFLDTSSDIVLMMENDPASIRVGVQLLSIAKSLERVGDHLTNIAEQILFEVDGRSDFTGRPRVGAA
jgi:phosphate transport system protein